jgi:hypothetical protein
MMLRYSPFAITLVLSVMAGAASAQDATPPATPEAATLQDFGAKNASCVEWNDGCATCLRDAAGLAHCSTPGIACQPREIACVKTKP